MQEQGVSGAGPRVRWVRGWWAPAAVAAAALTCWGAAVLGVFAALWVVPPVWEAAGGPGGQAGRTAWVVGVCAVLVVVAAGVLQFVPRALGARAPLRTSLVLLAVAVPVGGVAVRDEEPAALALVGVAVLVWSFVVGRWSLARRRMFWRAPVALAGFAATVAVLWWVLPQSDGAWTGAPQQEDVLGAAVLEHPEWEPAGLAEHEGVQEVHLVYAHEGGARLRVHTHEGVSAPTLGCAEAEAGTCEQVDTMVVRQDEEDPERVADVRMPSEQGGVVLLRWEGAQEGPQPLTELAAQVRPAGAGDAGELEDLPEPG
ncbi:hypothetical protein IDM40_12440 [Nocardiopsis sp. HNM0947]|uniref:Uncharacterized protein n=1 Tax=Nocardiopsis coralli TaxID=2772213 RepID=A0ABR9P6R8_9ACTN|nr:hypothetical protein [Nocardiopsis coralli]MBE2999509.1 hypothetical protein [Nocardiopsis coralli]